MRFLTLLLPVAFLLPTVSAQKINDVILKKDGCLFDFQLLAPPAHFAQGKPDFDRVVAGFSYPIR